MQILEFKTQDLVIWEGEETKMFLPIFDVDAESVININLEKDSKLELYVLGVLDKANVQLQINSRNIGENSEFRANVGFVQFGNSNVDFSGTMRVENGAINSTAKLHAESLVLSSNANVLLVPSLEIHENEVTASHGAVVKNIDQEQIFYLRSRGVSLEDANRVMIEGFVNSFDIELPEAVHTEFEKVLNEQFEKNVCVLECEFCK